MKAGQRQRASLLHALEDHTKDGTESEQTIAASMISALWDLATYEHLSLDWNLKTDQAISGVELGYPIDRTDHPIRSPPTQLPPR
jgi:hypothetical protein